MRKIKNKIVALLSASVLIAGLAACGAPQGDSSAGVIGGADGPTEVILGNNPENPAPKENVSVAVLKGPTGMGAVKLMDDAEKGITANDYTFILASAPDEVVAKITTGEADIAAVPTNLAAALYQKTGGNIQMTALCALGVLYILENGEEVTDVASLKGKTIYATGQGSNPEFVLNHILKENGLEPGRDVTVSFKAQHDELATLMAAGDVKLGMLPEPNVESVLMKNKDVRIALNLTEEWDKIVDNEEDRLTMSCIIVRREFAENNKDALDAFLEEFKKSIEFVNGNVPEAAELMEAYGIIPNAELAANAIPKCNLVFISGKEIKSSIEGYLSVLFNSDKSSVGGAMPDDEFYYEG